MHLHTPKDQYELSFAMLSTTKLHLLLMPAVLTAMLEGQLVLRRAVKRIVNHVVNVNGGAGDAQMSNGTFHEQFVH
jgi:hypothetical protein